MSDIPYSQDYTLKFRGSSRIVNPYEDPNHAGFTTGVEGFYEVDIAISGILPLVDYEGELKEGGGGRLYTLSDVRDTFMVSPKPSYVLYADSLADPVFPPFAIWDYAVRYVFPQNSLWCMGAYQNGSNPGAGRIPRSVMTRVWDVGTSAYVVTITDDYFEYMFPRLVVIEGAIVPTRKESGQVNIPDFKMISAGVL